MIVEWKFLEGGTMKVRTPVWEERQRLPEYIVKVFQTKEVIRKQEIMQRNMAYYFKKIQ